MNIKSLFNNIKKFAVSAAVCLSFSVFMTCSTGLGEEVDVEAPHLAITSPLRNTFQNKQFTLNGTAVDNHGVEKVVISEVTNINGVSKVTKLGEAKLTGENWSFDVTLEEGEKTIQCQALDKSQNTSIYSIQNITILVDETAPEGNAWYIDRGNGNQTSLRELKDLQDLDTNLSENIDYPQNVSFKVYGTMFDAFAIKDVKLIVKDEAGNQIFRKDNIGSSLYSPEFFIEESDFTNYDSKYASGRHYFQLFYYSVDENNNDNTRPLDWFIWYPESDQPNFYQNLEVNGIITVPVNSAIPLDTFDDDSLKTVYVGLITQEKYETISGAEDAKINALKGFSDSELISLGLAKSNVSSQINSQQIRSGSIPGIYYLVGYGQDATASAVTSARIWKTIVTDNNNPILFVENPTENTIPTIDEGETSKFTIKGYSLDTSGTASVKVVFVPNGITDPHNYAKNIAATDTTSEGSSKVFESGARLWNPNLKDEIDVSTDNLTWKKQSFKIQLDLLTDFIENKEKFFLFYVTDSDGNVVTQDFKLQADTSEPTLNIYKDALKTEELLDMYVCDYYTNGLVMAFDALKSSGLGIKDSSFKIYKDGDEEHPIASGPTVSFTKEQLKEIAQTNVQPRFTFYAEDLLGNSSLQIRTVVLTRLPTIEEITSDAVDTTYKAGDEITIQAKFSSSVRVTGTPRIKILYSASDATPKYANYAGGSGSETLRFTFTVPEGASSSKLYCPDADQIDLNGGKIETTDSNGGDAHLDTIVSGKNLQDSKTIKLDGIKPEIDLFTISCEDISSGSFSTTKEIKALISFTENVRVNGSPKLNLKVGSADMEFTFQGMEGTRVTFAHKIMADDPNGVVEYNKGKCFTESDSQFITDVWGNTLKLTSSTLTPSNVAIDTLAPVTPVLTDLVSGTYNSKQTITLGEVETGAKVEYSINGGSSWTTYIAPVELGTGTYQVTARQTDGAGNVSSTAAVVDLNIDCEFPAISDFICSLPDGSYPKDKVVDFKMTFEDKVTSGATATVTLSNTAGTKTVVAKSISQTTATTSVTFRYTIEEGVFIEGLKISAVNLTGIKDTYNNTASATAADGIKTSFARSGVILDAVSPVITSVVPKNATTTNGVVVAKNGNVVTVTFSEKVYKENGTITLKRKGNWGIPAVMTVEEFGNVYNKLSDTDKYYLNAKENNEDLLDSRTGIAIGPYKMITHGLKVSGSKYVPDISTKYVLDFNLGLFDGSTNIDPYGKNMTREVSKIREIFEKTGYHKQELDVSSPSVVCADNVVTLTFSNILEDGIEWTLEMTEGCFRDETGNLTAAVEEDTYSFWSDKVAKPYVRADRYSHGYGAKEPGSTGTLTEITAQTTAQQGTLANNSGSKVKPTGNCRVRIDSQTPGATLSYKVYNSGSGEASTISHTTQANITHTSIADIATATLDADFTGTTYSGYVIVGDGSYTNARKDYVAATGTKTGFTKSDIGTEGVFKTVLYMIYDSNVQINVEGGTRKGGMPSISGFPLRDAPSDMRFSKNAYWDSSKRAWVWNSYEMLSEWALLIHKGNYSRDYPTAVYGQANYIYRYLCWDD